MGKGKLLRWVLKLKVISTKEQGDILNKELENHLEAFEAGEENISHLLSDFENLRLGSRLSTQEDMEWN